MIEALGKKLIHELQEKGPFIALHPRYEMDMLAFSGCTYGCTEEEADELKRMRYAFPWWRKKEITSEERRSEGLCHLTPEEASMVLQALGIMVDGLPQTYTSLGHFERPPYNEYTMKSVYHFREYDVHKLMQVRMMNAQANPPKAPPGSSFQMIAKVILIAWRAIWNLSYPHTWGVIGRNINTTQASGILNNPNAPKIVRSSSIFVLHGATLARYFILCNPKAHPEIDDNSNGESLTADSPSDSDASPRSSNLRPIKGLRLYMCELLSKVVSVELVE